MTGIVPRIGKRAGTHHLDAIKSGNDNSAGSFTEFLAAESAYSVRELSVPGNCCLPLQTLTHTSQHLTVLSGIIHVTLGDDVFVLVADESLYISQGILNGLENRSDRIAKIISVDFHP